jgi:hypothetical protein
LLKRFTLFDAAVILALVVGAAFGVAAYRRFQMPAPRVSEVTPPRVVSGGGRHLSVHGRYLQPFLRVFVQPAGVQATLNTLENLEHQAKADVVTATRLDVTLPDVTPGAYDLYIFNEFQQVAFVPQAFTVVEPDFRRATMTATLRLFLPAGAPAPVVVGDRDASKPLAADATRTGGATVTAVRVDAARHDDLEMRLAHDAEDGTLWMGTRGVSQQVDVDLRVPLVMDLPDTWRYNGAIVRAGEVMSFETPRLIARGRIVWVSEPQ